MKRTKVRICELIKVFFNFQQAREAKEMNLVQ